jgi:pyruvate carboxylase
LQQSESRKREIEAMQEGYGLSLAVGASAGTTGAGVRAAAEAAEEAAEKAKKTAHGSIPP